MGGQLMGAHAVIAADWGLGGAGCGAKNDIIAAGSGNMASQA
jgi:hypothetical protein